MNAGKSDPSMRAGTVGAAARADFVRAGYWRDETLLDDFARNLARHPDRIAVVGHNSMTGRDCRLTTAELHARVVRIAAGLLRRGVGRGEVVSAQLPNWWEMIAVQLAVLRIGAVFNPLVPIFRERELAFMLSLARSRTIVIPECFRNHDHAQMLQRLQKRLPDLRHVLVIGTKGPNSFEHMLEEASDSTNHRLPERRPSPDDVIQLLYTSGTTGEPKGVMHTSNTLTANLRQHIRIWGFDDTNITLMASPLAHQTGFLYGIMLPIMVGGRVILQDYWRPAEAVDLIEREAVTYSIGSTPFLSDLLDSSADRPQALRSLRTFVAAGAPIPRHLVSRAQERFGVTVCSMWGMSENGPVAFTRPADPPARTLATDGCAVPGMEVRVVDEQGTARAAGCEGRLMVRGAGMFVGYLERPELYGTDVDGWLDTGDLACLDEHGYLRITGRSKDVIIRGGENIPVIEIENLASEHPAIAAIAIVAMPDPRLNERCCAFIELRPGHALTLDELTHYLRGRQCARQYLPERLEVLERMPRTATGKIQKFQLREWARVLKAAGGLRGTTAIQSNM
jgi:cyclohexanecarboxylate-CoA ligase